MDSRHQAIDAPLSDLPFAIVDLHRRAVRLRAGSDWRGGERASSLLVHDAGVRVELTSLRRGAAFQPTQPGGAVLLSVVEGAALVERQAETVRIDPGQLAYFGAGTVWRARAALDSALLLSVEWPSDAATGPEGGPP